jgi:hypothetical protein
MSRQPGDLPVALRSQLLLQVTCFVREIAGRQQA